MLFPVNPVQRRPDIDAPAMRHNCHLAALDGSVAAQLPFGGTWRHGGTVWRQWRHFGGTEDRGGEFEVLRREQRLQEREGLAAAGSWRRPPQLAAAQLSRQRLWPLAGVMATAHSTRHAAVSFQLCCCWLLAAVGCWLLAAVGCWLLLAAGCFGC